MSVATREVRFAVVLYGGTSLAIYMNGISQELLRMVRGSADGIGDLDEVEKIYSRLAEDVAPGQRTRFIVDIVSGTSAGGINGVALAKALVVGSRNLNVLRDTWTEKANIDTLLADRGPLGGRWSRSESVLDGAHMYDLLHDTLAAMGDATKGKPLVDMVDLFVTATDLRGRQEAVQLTGTSVDEPVHKTVFRFAFEADPDDPENPVVNDFASDAMLAFAARCTSSFPIAFPPMSLGAVPARRRAGEDLGRFFPGGVADETRLYADGGYLDVKPFSYAIDLIPARPASLPGERKLLFVDPFPEGRNGPGGTGGSSAEADIDFIANARLAATTLPRREVIREDIRQINAINRRLERLSALQARWSEDKRVNPEIGKLLAARKPDGIETLYLDDLVNGDGDREGYGAQYPLYHHLRVYGTTDMLSNLVAGLAGFAAESGEGAYLRQVVRAWRDGRYSAYRETGTESETAYLAEYDLDFRRRRLVHLRAAVAESGKLADPAVRELWRVVEAELGRLRRMTEAGVRDRGALLGGSDVAAIFDVLDDDYEAFCAEPDLSGRYEIASRVYEKAAVKPLVDQAMTEIGKSLRARFDAGSDAVKSALTQACDPAFTAAYAGFHWHDIVTFPFLEGTSAEEHGEVQIFRVSPADNDMNGRADKLAGISFGAFGGFLSRDWREHDILWGRLDGAERIVTALLPSPGDAAKRAKYVAELRAAILAQEFGAASTNRRDAMVRRLIWQGKEAGDALERRATAAGTTVATEVAAFLRGTDPLDVTKFGQLYDKPLPPETRVLAGWGSRAGRILAQMLDDLPPGGALREVPSRLANPLRTGSVLAARLTLFAAPGSYHGMLAERLLFLLGIIGAVLVGVALMVRDSVPPWIGAAVLGVAVGAWIALYVVGRALRGRTPLPEAARWLAILLGIGLIVLGAWSVVEWARGLYAAYIGAAPPG